MSEEVKSASEQKKEDWMNSKWRPMMGWMYMIVCLCDFVIFPVLWALLHAVLHTANMAQWNPLTLQGAGLFHIAMGAVLGIAAFGRTQEKLGGANNGGANVSSSGFTAPSAPASGFGSSPGGFSSPAPVTNSFGSQPLGSGSGFGSTPSAPTTSFTPPASWGATPVATTASGKKIVPDEPQPAI
jgi:hypothetical protein